MMTEGINHAPFIIGSYAVAVVLLGWCAFSPIFRKKAALRRIRKRIKLEDHSRDTNS